MYVRALLLCSSVALATVGCVTIPQGPGIGVMPGSGKTLAQFQSDDTLCRNFANQQVSGTTPNEAAAVSAGTSAVVGTALGAAAGAAFGGGHGAAIGAGSGLLAGSALGAGAAATSAGAVQSRYDLAYAQCMETQGNRLPPARDTYAGAPPSYPPDGYYYPAPPPVYYGPPHGYCHGHCYHYY